MQRKCPNCGGLNVRRSAVVAPEVTGRHILLSPYRCRDCRERFFVVSRHAYYLAAIFGMALVVGALAFSIGITTEPRSGNPDPTASDRELFVSRTKLAETGDPVAEHELAKMYASGFGVPKSDVDARKWLERAAEHGDVTAQYELGVALRDGRGAIQDYRGALKWITLAAETGHGRAQFALGVMYRLGIGTPVDAVKAYTWLNLAAAQGVEGAATIRDAVLGHLTQAEIDLAQAEARRMHEARKTSPDAGAKAEAGCKSGTAGREPECPASADARP